MTQPLSFGRKPPIDKPALMLSSFLKDAGTPLPPHPLATDYLSAIRDWQMLGNDYFGDCVAVTAANERHVVNKVLSGKDTYSTVDQVFAFYRTQNPNFQPNPNDPVEDNGMVIQTALETLIANGDRYFDGVKPLAFAKVDHTNLEEVKSALAIFGMLWVGINVQRANMYQFNDNEPWDYVSGSPDDGGHSVVAGGYLSQPTNDVRFITWGEETGFTDNFWNHQVEEAWVVIWPEHLGTTQFEAGVDQAALAAAYESLTGRSFPVQPTPEPVPTPTPVPVPPAPTPEEDTITVTMSQKQYDRLTKFGYHPFDYNNAKYAARAWRNVIAQ